MKPQIALSILSIAAMMLACNMPATSGQPVSTLATEAATQPSAANTAVQPTNAQPAEPPTATLTPLPLDTATPAPTATSSVPALTPAKDPVNCRFGPGVEWLAVGALNAGETANIQGKTADGNWWYIQMPANPEVFCWVAASVTVPSGNYAAVAVTAPPEAIVTKVTLELDPTEVTVPGCTFPYTPINLKGEITTNGPTVVEWHWETSQGDESASDTLKFDKYDTFPVSDYVKYDKEGTYTVKLVVTQPNSVVAQAKYKVVCGP